MHGASDYHLRLVSFVVQACCGVADRHVGTMKGYLLAGYVQLRCQHVCLSKISIMLPIEISVKSPTWTELTDLLAHRSVFSVLLAPCTISASVRVHGVIIIDDIIHSTSLLLVAELVQHTEEILTVHTRNGTSQYKTSSQCRSRDHEITKEEVE
jgi:hypothetical protein